MIKYIFEINSIDDKFVCYIGKKLLFFFIHKIENSLSNDFKLIIKAKPNQFYLLKKVKYSFLIISKHGAL
jgi:hypothetical protein